MLNTLEGNEMDRHYAAYFRCFNERLYYEAHEVLEVLWLPRRRQGDGNFYKGLIQLAAAFVHLQKNRLQPAAALLCRAEYHLRLYPPLHHGLDVGAVVKTIQWWLGQIEAGQFDTNPLTPDKYPKLEEPVTKSTAS